MQYNYKIKVKYENNTEYRDCFRKVFRIDSEKILENLKMTYTDIDTFEDETIDELIFDEPKVNDIMGEILDNTLHINEFKTLYLKTAGLVINTVPDVGLAILLAYDYFKEFHAVLSEYFNLLDSFKENGDFSENEKKEAITDLLAKSYSHNLLMMKLGIINNNSQNKQNSPKK